MSQQGMTIVSLVTGADRDLSDIEYLAIKEFDGKRVDVNNNGLSLSDTTTETDLVTQTANTGKDMYLGEVSADSIVDLSSGGALDVTARLYINGVVVETLSLEDFVDTNGPDNMYTYPFKTKGKKVAAGQIIKVTIQNGSAAVSQRSLSKGKLILWEETTGETPQIPSI